MKDKKINIIMKVTDACNLRCVYCYNSPHKYQANTMDLHLIKILLDKVVDNYKEVHFIWHGGEPLLPGVEYYKKIFELQEYYIHNIEIINSIQTNATLITDEFAKLLHNKNVGIGVSYDGEVNESTRGKSYETLRGISILKKYEKRIPAIKVVLKEDLNQLINVYHHFNNLNIDLKLNHLFNCDLQNIRNHYTSDEYIKSMKELFLYWINDKYCRIHLQPFEYYLAMNKNLPNRECVNSSCLLTYLSMDYQGNIFPCSRFHEEEFCYGNIKNIKNINQIYDSEGFMNILKPTVLRRQQCMKMCKLYSFCQGGCSHDALLELDEVNSNFFSCTVFKRLFEFIQQYCTNSKASNPMIMMLM